MYVLGIETSCDETAAAITKNERALSNIVATQSIHAKYGGVVPEFASRAHIRQLMWIIQSALDEAQIKKSDLDGLAVTYGPGLAGSLLVGLNVAKAIAYSLSLPWIGVNHIEGHIFAVLVNQNSPITPFLCLVVSGGHTQIVYVEGISKYRILGRTIDDAAGEAFDKVAKVLGLPYPGGPAIEATAKKGDPKRISFPRALLAEDNLDFSFSGLKTSVLYHIRGMSNSEIQENLHHIAACFQAAVVDVLVAKTMRAVERLQVNHLVVAGGVACNSNLREKFKFVCAEKGINLSIPSPVLCTDNALMIARIGYEYLSMGIHSSFDLGPMPSLDIPSI